MTAPRVSVLLITRDHEAQVERALASIDAQTTGEPVEVVVADDASSDGTLRLVEAWAGRTGHDVRILPGEAPLGAAINLHRGLTACRGRYVAVLHGDGAWASGDRLRRQVELLDRRMELSAAASGSVRVYRAELLERLDPSVFEVPTDASALDDVLDAAVGRYGPVELLGDGAPDAAPDPVAATEDSWRVLVLDDYFPTKGTGFRIAEYDWMLRHGVAAEVMTSVEPLEPLLAEYATLYPDSAGSVSAYDAQRFGEFDCAALVFLNNAAHMLGDLERSSLPFVLTLYPGGGLNLGTRRTERLLDRVLASPQLAHVVTTQPLVTELVRARTGGSVPVTEVIGGPVGRSYLSPGAGLRTNYHGSSKPHLDVCFVAQRYTADGLDKGWPVFLESMRMLVDAGLPVRGHVVGGFGPDQVGDAYADLPLTFASTLSTPELRRFYMDMDVIVSPTAAGLIAPGAFDGFPTGASVEAALCGVALVVTDPLGQNRLFTDRDDIHITRADAAEITQRILDMLAEPDGIRRVGQAGLRTVRQAYGVDAQLETRRRVLESVRASRRDRVTAVRRDPLVSILVPTYNGERFLRTTLRSALAQSYRNIEVVVGDDGSTDGTPGILASFAAEDPRVRVLRFDPNVGPLENPRRLLAEARGEYVKFLMHDDVLGTDCVRELVRGMEANPVAMLAFSHRVLIDENGKAVPGHDFVKLSERPGLLDGRQLGDVVLVNCSNVIGEPTTVLFRREDVSPEELWMVDGRTVDVLNDVQLWLQLLADGPAFYTPRSLSRFRHHAGQNSFNPRYVGRAERDWSRLIDWAARSGFLVDPAQEKKAHARALQLAAARTDELIGVSGHGAALEAAFLSIARLVELGTGAPADGRGLAERAHDRRSLDRFAQELDVWTREHPVAVAAPALDPVEIGQTVQALREVMAARAAAQAVVAVPPEDLERAIPLLEAALAAGPDVDFELVPSDAPEMLFTGPWLAVAPRTSTWHEGRGLAQWAIDAPRTGPAEVPVPREPVSREPVSREPVSHPPLAQLGPAECRSILADMQAQVGDFEAMWAAMREDEFRRSGRRTDLLARVDARFIDDFDRRRTAVPAAQPYFTGTHAEGVRYMGDARDWPSALQAVDPACNRVLIDALKRELSRRPGNYVDVGTNIGVVAASMAAHLGPDGQVLAFEPSPDTMRLAASTFGLNEADNVTLFNAAVSDADGSLVFNATPGNSAIASARRHNFGLLNTWKQVTVPAVRLDTLHAAGELAGVSLVKIDVEGHEPSVIRGALRFLAETRPTVVYEYTPMAAADHGWTQEESIALISRAGDYEFEAVAESDGSVLPFPLPAGYLGQVNVFARPV